MNPLQILTQLLGAAVRDPARTSLFAQQSVNTNIKDPFIGFLPRNVGSEYNFEASALNMVVTPLQPVAMNSPYPVIGTVAPNVWKGETDKYAGEVIIDEPTFRQIQNTLYRLQASQLNTLGVKTAQEFVQKILANLRDAADLSEKLARAEAIMTGRYVGKAQLLGVKASKLIGKADYGVNRVKAAGAYDKPSSTFWQDLTEAERRLLGVPTARYISEYTLTAIKANPANGAMETSPRVMDDATGSFKVRLSRMAQKTDGTYDTLSKNFDAQYQNIEFTVIKTAYYDVPGADGKMVRLNYGNDGTIAILGASVIGELYVGPTVEGAWKGVALDRFVRIEQNRSYEAAGRATENFAPVVSDYRNLTIIETGIAVPDPAKTYGLIDQ